MRKLAVLVAVAGASLSSCSPRRLVVANTPEGNACRRDCMQIFETCRAGRHASTRHCRMRENECLVTCPGFENRPVSMPPEPQPIPEGQKCIASELPEWKTASGAEKKELMDRCKADFPAP